MADEPLIPPPDDPFGLWQAIGARGHWPLGNEVVLRQLGEGLTNSGIEFGGAGGRLLEADVHAAWPDPAGVAYGDTVRGLAANATTVSQQLKQLGGLATEYGKDVAYAKQAIVKLVNENGRLYASQTVWPGLPDTAQRQQFAARLGARITTFLDQMAARLRARGTGAPASPPPVLKPVSPADGVDRTEGVAFHLSGSLLGRGVTGSLGVALVDGKLTFVESHGTYVTSDPMPSGSATVGAIESNATEPGQLTQTTGSAGGSAAVPLATGTAAGGRVRVGTVVAHDESWGQDADGDTIRVHEPQIGVGAGLNGPTVPARVPAYPGPDHAPGPARLPEERPSGTGLPGEAHSSSTTTHVWAPFD